MASNDSAFATISALCGAEWAIDPLSHESLVRAAQHYLAAAAAGNAGWPTPEDEAMLAVGAMGFAELRIDGPVMNRPGAFAKKYLGVVDLQELTATAKEAARRADIKAVLLNISSPGGTVNGTSECADALRELALKKPVVAFTDSMMGSAAYWLGVTAHGIIATGSATVGSISAMLPFVDSSKLHEKAGIAIDVLTNEGAIFKGAGVPGTSLKPEQRAQLIERLNATAVQFKKAVLARRPQIKAETMRGQAYYGWQSRAVGLIDAVGSINDAWNHLSKLVN